MLLLLSVASHSSLCGSSILGQGAFCLAWERTKYRPLGFSVNSPSPLIGGVLCGGGGGAFTFSNNNSHQRLKMPYYMEMEGLHILTSICVCFRSVTVLVTTCPRALVARRRRDTLPDTVTTFETARPFASVNPSIPRLNAQPVPSPILPLALEREAAERGKKEARN